MTFTAMHWANQVLCLVVGAAIAAFPKGVVGQDANWRIAGQVGLVAANGHFTATRPNGKVITSDIDNGLYQAIQIERRVGASWGLIIGYEGSVSREFSIFQSFPDGTSFRSADSFTYSAITFGPVWHFRRDAPISFGLEVYGSWGWLDDVSLAGAGPPYDRTAPLAIDVESHFGAGVALHVTSKIGGSGWMVIGRGGLTAQRFQGLFPEDPLLPGSDGDVDTPFNPLYFGVGLSRTF